MESQILTEVTLVDTDILIDASRQDPQAIACLDQIERESALAVSTITQMELLVGCRNKTELRKTETFLKRFSIVKLNQDISDQAIRLIREYRLSHGLLIPDAIIAATALVMNQGFITKNQRDFCFIPNLCLLRYPRP